MIISLIELRIDVVTTIVLFFVVNVSIVVCNITSFQWVPPTWHKSAFLALLVLLA